MHWRIHTEQQRKFQPNRLEDHAENVTFELNYRQHTIAADIATFTFNEGTRGLLAVFDAMGIKLGPHAHTFSKEEYSIRVEAANRRSLENTREAGVARRRLKISADAATKAEEGTLYGPGIDDSV